jgi:hypothetical protein
VILAVNVTHFGDGKIKERCVDKCGNVERSGMPRVSLQKDGTHGLVLQTSTLSISEATFGTSPHD